MYRLLAIVVAAIAGAAFWRRREIRTDAERASKAIGDAAVSARSRMRPGADGSDGSDGDVGDVEPAPPRESDSVEDPDNADSSSRS